MLTLVIWLWAEGESVSVESMPVTVSFVSPEGSRLLIDPAEPPPVTVTVEGATRQLRAFRERFGGETIQHTLRYDPEAGPRRQVLYGEVLQQAGAPEWGVTIRGLQPETVAVRVERLVEVTVPVRARTGNVSLAGPVSLQPETATLTVPESLTDAAGDAAIEVRLTPSDVEGLAPNQPHSRSVDLAVPGPLRSEWTRMSPTSAEMTFTLSDVTEEATLTTVPVHISVSPLLTRRYDIEVPEEQRVLRDVVLSGPHEVIDRIRERDPATPRVVAVLEPTEADLAAGEATLPPRLRVPAGVTVESAIPTVTVTTTPRNGDNGG